MRRFAGIASALLLAAAPAHALPKILICQADANFDGGTMIQTLLANTKAFGAVDMIDCSVNTPSVAKLKMYDGVFLWDDNMFADPTTLGNNLADYVDAGGGVVQAQFNLYAQTFGISYQLGGRWLSGNYNCLNPADTTTFDSLNPKPNDATSP